jgi:hypothetical protein
MRRVGGLAPALLLAACGANPGSFERVASERLDRAGLLLTEQRWISPDADLVAELTTEPVECLAVPDDEAAARAVAAGRVAFRAPALLGGQAARAGLSCAACHENGRDNPVFVFAGVSGAPGTADVTSSFFSSHRGDGVDNPVPIPDLGGPRERLKVDRAPESGALEAFIRGLIVEEFDGPEPPPAVLAGLAAYVRALSPEACPAEAFRAVVLQDRLADADAAVEAGVQAYLAGDADTAVLMIEAARGGLGEVHERFAGLGNAELREGLVAASATLSVLQRAMRDGREPTVIGGAVAAWRDAFAPLASDLSEAEPASLYAQDVLSRALAE